MTAPLSPPAVLESRTESSFVAVHIGLPEMALFPDFFPSNDLFGAELAGHLLTAALRREGHLTAPAHLAMAGHLFDSAGMVEVADPIGAAEVIVRELCGTLLSGSFQVAIRSDGHWEAVWPNDGANLDSVFEWERIFKASERMLEAIRARFSQLEFALNVLREQLQAATAEAERQQIQRTIASLETTVEGFRSLLAGADESDHTS